MEVVLSLLMGVMGLRGVEVVERTTGSKFQVL
jgi:hypothetical protein